MIPVPVLNPCSGWVPLYIHIFDIIHQHFPPLIFVNYRCTIYCNTGTKPETISRLFGCQYFPMTHVILTLWTIQHWRKHSRLDLTSRDLGLLAEFLGLLKEMHIISPLKFKKIKTFDFFIKEWYVKYPSYIIKSSRKAW